MPLGPQPPVIALCQLQMHWTIEENMTAMLDAVELARRRGAAICAFPELAVTGFHRQIVALAEPALIAPQIQRLQAACARHAIAVTVGAPTFGTDGERFNSHLFIDERGELVAVVSKVGLTAPEATFFDAGQGRPIARLQGLRCSAVICREIEDHALIETQLPPGSVDLIFWPGQMRPDPDQPVTDPPAHVVQAQHWACSSGAHFVQANWPNALNRPEESAGTGRSAVIAPSGELLFRLPAQASGVALFTLGERRFDWHPRPV